MPRIFNELKVGQQVWLDFTQADLMEVPENIRDWQPQAVIITAIDRTRYYSCEINRVAWVSRHLLCDEVDFEIRYGKETEYYFGKKSQPTKQHDPAYCGCEEKQSKHIRMDTFEYDYCCGCGKEIK